jgi:hypothetical protein
MRADVDRNVAMQRTLVFHSSLSVFIQTSQLAAYGARSIGDSKLVEIPVSKVCLELLIGLSFQSFVTDYSPIFSYFSFVVRRRYVRL